MSKLEKRNIVEIKCTGGPTIGSFRKLHGNDELYFKPNQLSISLTELIELVKIGKELKD